MEMDSGKTGAVPNRGWHLVRIAVALVLLTAAATKCHQCCSGPIPGTGLFSAKWFVICLVEAEWLGSLVLLACILAKPSWAVTLTCFSAFALVSLGKGLMGEASCGCFGRALPVNPFVTATLDFAIVVSLLRWRPKQSLFSIQRAIAVLVIWALIGIPAAYAMASYSPTMLSDAGDIIGSDAIILLEPEKWIGRRFPLLDYINIGDKLKTGKWIVVLYRHDCPDCRTALPKYERLSRKLAARGEAVQVALIEVPPYSGNQWQLDSPDMEYSVGRLSNAREWLVATPLAMILERAMVNEIGNGKNPPAKIASNESWAVEK